MNNFNVKRAYTNIINIIIIILSILSKIELLYLRLLVGGDSEKQNLYPLDMDKGKFTLWNLERDKI